MDVRGQDCELGNSRRSFISNSHTKVQGWQLRTGNWLPVSGDVGGNFPGEELNHKHKSHATNRFVKIFSTWDLVKVIFSIFCKIKVVISIAA